MSRDLTVSDHVTVATDAMTLWSAVADPSQMPRWSPENIRGDVASPGRPLRATETFVGSNRRGRARWQTECVVTESEPGRVFAFDVRAIGPRRPVLRAAIASWRYTFAETDGATVVTETWTDGRRGWPDVVALGFDKLVTGGKPFADFQRRNIARTLAALKADFEGDAAS